MPERDRALMRAEARELSQRGARGSDRVGPHPAGRVRSSVVAVVHRHQVDVRERDVVSNGVANDVEPARVKTGGGALAA